MLHNRIKKKYKTTEAIIMLRFGAVTIDVSHPKTFAKVLSEGNRAQYTGVFNDGFRSDEEVREYADTYGIKIYDNLDEMIDNIDVGLVHSCNWDKHLDYIMHFVNKGKPVFVDKPLVGNLKDCERLLELARGGAKILGTSAMRFCREVSEAKEKMKAAGSRPLHVVTIIGIDEYNYAIHAIELVCGVIDSRPVSCRYIGTANIDKDAEKCESYFIRFENGATATCHLVGKKYVLSNTIIITDSTAPESDLVFIPAIEGLYNPLLDRICESVEEDKNALATMEEMVDAIKVLLAGRASREDGGAEVMLSDTDRLMKISFDGYEFERGYSAAAIAARKK